MSAMLHVDLTAYQHGKGGGFQSYANNLLDALVPQRPAGIDIRLICNVRDELHFRKFASAGVQIVPLRFDTLWKRVLQTSRYYGSLRSGENGLFLANFRPPAFRGTAITVVHDLQYRVLPQFWPAWKRFARDQAFRSTFVRSEKLIAISEQTKAEITLLGASFGSKTRVINNPIVLSADTFSKQPHSVLKNQSEAQIVGHLRNKKFYLTPSTLLPHKNTVAMAHAIDSIASTLPEDVVFVFVGHFKKNDWQPNVSSHVLPLGFVSLDLLAWLSANTVGYVLPSIYEGFGMPYIEAAVSRKPCLACDLRVVNDLLGSSAEKIQRPYGRSEIALALAEFVSKTLRKEIIPASVTTELGFFSPEYVARQYWNVVTDSLQNRVS
jgi:glycosyltransferase involved in cell wall biosynthesis